MDLYLILFAIAALGIVALMLIFFGHTKQPQSDFLSPQKNTEMEENNQFPARLQNRIAPSLDTKNIRDPLDSDPALASLGFSAYDGLLSEHQPDPELAISVKPEFQQYHSVKPTQKIVGKADLIILYLMAPQNQPFRGYELLQVLLAADLRFGKMNIFHRYAEETDPESILFSVASAINPGSFDMANIGAVSCPGLSLFMSISAVQDPMTIFDLILETAQLLSDDLGGILCDSEREPLTEETLAEYRDRILSQ